LARRKRYEYQYSPKRTKRISKQRRAGGANDARNVFVILFIIILIRLILRAI